jgi:hypothetical protein
MAEQPTAIYLGVFSRAEQRVLAAISRAMADDGGRCVATLAMLARNAGASRTTARNAINRAVAIGLLAKIERRSYCAPSLPNILMMGRPQPHAGVALSPLELPEQTEAGLTGFRTIQVCPKDLRALPGHPEPAVSWHSGFRGGAHARRKATPVHHAARWHGRSRRGRSRRVSCRPSGS